MPSLSASSRSLPIAVTPRTLPAGRDEPAVLQRGSGVVDLEVVLPVEPVEAGDLISLFILDRIPAGSGDDADAGVVVPLDIYGVELFVDDGVDDLYEIGPEPRENDLRLRVAEA